MKMKDKKHIKSFLEHTEKLNISDVSDSGLFESKLGDGKFMIIDIKNSVYNK